MELRHLRYFVVIAEELHFGRAAARLHITQPSLSIQIRDLERAVGAPLLQRTNRRVELTEAGRAFLEGARLALAQVETAVQDAHRAHRGEIGQLTLGFVGSAAYDILPRLLRAFRATYPDVALHLGSMTTKEQLVALSERRIDLGLLRLPVKDAALAWRTVAREPLMAVLPITHPLATQTRVPLRALAGEPFILYPRSDSPAIRDTIIALCHQAGFSPNIVQETGEMQTIVGLVAGGIGIALVIAPEGYRGTGDVVFKALAGDNIPTWEMALAWRLDSEASPVIRACLTAIAPAM
ncbi:MAG TPA: LysR substrate-binding domain-containing protein [Ktedonobacterales bacterium]|nr:LysR substrate-binding domain-containing protein [Ktedonobacterales bacterium]